MAKKKQSYGDMRRAMADTSQRMEAEKERMAAIMASALMTDANMMILGDFSDAKLRVVVSRLSVHVKEYAAQVQAEKQGRKQLQ